jgi:hypothetical protein
MNHRRLLKVGLVCTGIVTIVGGSTLVASSAAASGAMVTQVSTVTVDSANPAVIDVGTLNSQFSSITITATGVTTWCNNSPWPPCTSDPAGNNNYGYTPYPTGTAPNLHTGALIAKVGVNGTWSVVNGSYVATSPVPTDVYVAYNDDVFWDNTGSYALTVTRLKPAS